MKKRLFLSAVLIAAVSLAFVLLGCSDDGGDSSTLTYEEQANAYKSTHQSALALDVETVLVADEPIVNAAITAYNALDLNVQAFLGTEYALLTSLKAKIGKLKSAENFKTTHQIALALETGTVQIDNYEIIDAALTAYELLEMDVQDLLTEEKELLEDLLDAIIGLFVPFTLNAGANNSAMGMVSQEPAGAIIPITSVTLEASEEAGYKFIYWTVNGVKAGTNTTLPAREYTDTDEVVAVFIHEDLYVTSNADTNTPGTLRYAIGAVGGLVAAASGASGFDIIFLALDGTKTIEIDDNLPFIESSMTIEGNGTTLKPSAAWDPAVGQGGTRDDFSVVIVHIYGTLTLRGLHFTDFLTMNYSGGVIWNYNSNAITVLESCIFSNNITQVTIEDVVYGSGAAIRATGGDVIVRGCTFYNNEAGMHGGAISLDIGGNLTLTGNLFWKNSGDFSYNVFVNATASGSSGGYNVFGGNGDTNDAWEKDNGITNGWFDYTNHDMLFSEYSIADSAVIFDSEFKPLGAYAYTSWLTDTDIPDFPATDFYGNPRTGSSGAVNP